MDAITPKEAAIGIAYMGSLNIPMASLEAFSTKRSNQCRFMPADEPRPLYLCCGQETELGKPYCPHHFALTRRSIAGGAI